MKARGWAVVQNGNVLVDTVGWTRRAAIVNWLRGHTDERPSCIDADDAIELMWAGQGGGGFSTPSGYCPQVTEVEIRLNE